MSGLTQTHNGGRRIGYARVSTTDQKLNIQMDALNAANCDLIYKDHGVSGAKASRPGLDNLLQNIQSGDTIVVFKLDRLGRSVLHLSDLLVQFRNKEIHFCSLSEGINTTTPGGKLVYHLFSAFAEFQRDIIVENTREGMRAAKHRGSPIGRPRSLDLQAVELANEAIVQDGVSIKEAARSLKVSRMTLDRAIKRLRMDVTA